jgi:formate dehydrogenase subunit delta
MSDTPPHEAAHGGVESLVKMANDISHFFRAEPKREDAVAGIANHIARYWTRRMREKLFAQVQRGEPGLEDLPREALQRLQSDAAAKTPKP